MKLLLAEGILGLDLLEILLHMINFVVLLILVRLILYKPVKKIMDSRTQKIQDRYNESERLKTEAEAFKNSYENLAGEAERKLASISQEALKSAEGQAAEIIKDANIKADGIVVSALQNIENERLRQKKELEGEVTNLAVNIAGRIISKNLTAEENKKVIDESLNAWKNEKTK